MDIIGLIIQKKFPLQLKMTAKMQQKMADPKIIWQTGQKMTGNQMPKQAHRMMLQSNRMYARLKTIKQCFRLISWTMIQKRSWME